MVRRRSFRAALVAAATVVVSTIAVAGPANADDPDLRHARAKAADAAVERAAERAAVTSRRAARRTAARATPLAVVIDTLTPSSIPARGDIRVSGTVTNTDSIPWLTVNVYSFVSQEPMTTRAELAVAVDVDESVSVGERITDIGSFATIDAIQPGETRPFTFAVDRDLLDAATPGVYWFGVHALGQRADQGRDELALADGRARTFLPLVPTRREGQEAVSVVVPLRRTIVYRDDGSLDDLDQWTRTLNVGGRLRSLVELGSTAGARTISWVVDPALLDAVRQLAAGNPVRSLDPNLEEGEPDGEDDTAGSPTVGGGGEQVNETPTTETPSDPAGADPGEDPTTAALSEGLDPEAREAAESAREWLGRLSSAMGEDDEVLAVPYGDTDVSAATRHGRRAFYLRARGRSAGPLPVTGLPSAPTIAPPSGYLSPEAIRAVEPDSTILVSDKMFTAAPAVASLADRRLVVTSEGAAAGGPGPSDPRGAIAMRQRILAEAAIRFLKPARTPLVVLLPYDWVPPASSTFFTGFDLDWLDLTSVAAAAGVEPAEAVSPEDLRYPQHQVDFELDAANFTAADALLEAGESLQDMLTLNNLVGATVSDQSLASTSYSARSRPDSARASTDRSRAWIEERIGQVQVDAPQAVTLSSINGSFPASISNLLDQPVTVSLAAGGSDDDELRIAEVGEVDLPAKGSATVLLEASTDTPGIHDVTIVVTDKSGRPLGGSDDLSIRSARVSNVIWLFLVSGIGLLFGTIAFRLVRRVRAARR